MHTAGEALVPCGNGGKKKGLEDRHRDEEQDALRDASSQKGRSRVCGARYVWPRERESRAGGKKEDSLVFTSSLSRLTPVHRLAHKVRGSLDEARDN